MLVYVSKVGTFCTTVVSSETQARVASNEAEDVDLVCKRVNVPATADSWRILLSWSKVWRPNGVVSWGHDVGVLLIRKPQKVTGSVN